LRRLTSKYKAFDNPKLCLFRNRLSKNVFCSSAQTSCSNFLKQNPEWRGPLLLAHNLHKNFLYFLPRYSVQIKSNGQFQVFHPMRFLLRNRKNYPNWHTKQKTNMYCKWFRRIFFEPHQCLPNQILNCPTDSHLQSCTNA